MPSIAHKLTRFAGAYRLQALVALLFPAMLACESGAQVRDGSVPQTQKVAEVLVRLEHSSSGALPALSALAFRADVTDQSSGDVLGAVDILVAPPPESGCELRDVASQARALRAQGGAISLEELSGVSVLADLQSLSLAPVVYPPNAEVVGGVIAEAGPVDITRVPETLTIDLPGSGEHASKVFWAVPAAPRVLAQDQTALSAGAPLDASGDLVVFLTGPQRTFLEIRPYGAPVALACAAGPGGRVVVDHQLLVRMTSAAGRVPVMLEAVWRESRTVPATPPTRVSVEARSSTVVDLRP